MSTLAATFRRRDANALIQILSQVTTFRRFGRTLSAQLPKLMRASALGYSTYFGGEGFEVDPLLPVDDAGNIIPGGDTDSLTRTGPTRPGTRGRAWDSGTFLSLRLILPAGDPSGRRISAEKSTPCSTDWPSMTGVQVQRPHPDGWLSGDRNRGQRPNRGYLQSSGNGDGDAVAMLGLLLARFRCVGDRADLGAKVDADRSASTGCDGKASRRDDPNDSWGDCAKQRG